jgi:isoleucyl-tRNA synthetase
MPGYLLKDSVHLTLWPDKQIQLINEDSEKAMHMAQEICSLAHALRKGNSLKVRQPLQKILVPMSSESSILALRMVEDLIKSEINVKEIEILTAEDERLSRKIKPNFKKLGKQYGPRLQEVAKLIQSFSQSEIVLLEKQGQIEAGGFSLSLEDVEIAFNDVAGWAVATLDSLTVALDLHLTPELVKEGIARELVNRIQNLRKQQNLEVTDKIRLLIQPYDQQVNEAIEEYKAYISAETQAVELRLSDQLKNPLDLEMDDFSLKVDLRVA